MVTAEQLSALVARMRNAGTDFQRVEVEAAVGRLPKTTGESVSALANGSGGLLIFSLSAPDGFTPASGFNAARCSDALATLCSDALVPPVRPAINIIPFEGADVVVAEIPETAPQDKPCYLATRGMYRGSFIRTGDGDRLLSPYEIDRLVEERTQPRYDLDPVEGATLDDLDTSLVQGVLARQRALHPRIFGRLNDARALAALNVTTVDPHGNMVPTLAGLLALGTYPQHFFPRLTVTFTCFPGTTKADASGVKYLDSETMAGPIPAVLLDTVAAVRRNMRVGGVLEGPLRRDVPEYPLDAVREAVCNAPMHRDYSPQGRGPQVQVNMYADRLEVLSPGGLYGAVTVDTIGEVGASSTRNQYLSALLETTPYESGGFVAENRGTGFGLIEAELAANGMRPPLVIDRPSLFSLTMWKRDALVEGDRAEGGARGAAPCARAPRGTAAEVTKMAIQQRGVARTSDVVADTGLPRSTVSHALRTLLERGVIEVAPASGTSSRSPKRAYRLVADRGAFA